MVNKQTLGTDSRGPRVYEGGGLARKAFHLLAGSSVPAIALLTTGNVGLWLAVALTSLFVAGEALRLHYEPFNLFLARIIGPLMKERERNSVTAATYMLVATSFCFGVFDKQAAALALLLASVGDPAAAIVGKRFGKIRLVGSKTLEGSLAFFSAGASIGLSLAIRWPGYSGPVINVGVAAALAGTAVATVAEQFAGRFTSPLLSAIDDNVLSPVLAATIITVLR